MIAQWLARSCCELPTRFRPLVLQLCTKKESPSLSCGLGVRRSGYGAVHRPVGYSAMSAQDSGPEFGGGGGLS
jgi:hypothetical protein